MYERINAKAEAAGLGQERRRLLPEARGATVEIGAGTGLNVALYPAELERLVLVEPDANMAARLVRRVASSDPRQRSSTPEPRTCRSLTARSTQRR
jgi:hypothetical protein